MRWCLVKMPQRLFISSASPFNQDVIMLITAPSECAGYGSYAFGETSNAEINEEQGSTSPLVDHWSFELRWNTFRALCVAGGGRAAGFIHLLSQMNQ
ncbi:uncharacterized protein V6R79_022013 [Siganus canaliculatus]